MPDKVGTAIGGGAFRVCLGVCALASKEPVIV